MRRRGSGAAASHQHPTTMLHGRHAQVQGHYGTQAFFIRRDSYTSRATTNNYQLRQLHIQTCIHQASSSSQSACVCKCCQYRLQFPWHCLQFFFSFFFNVPALARAALHFLHLSPRKLRRWTGCGRLRCAASI